MKEPKKDGSEIVDTSEMVEPSAQELAELRDQVSPGLNGCITPDAEPFELIIRLARGEHLSEAEAKHLAEHLASCPYCRLNQIAYEDAHAAHRNRDEHEIASSLASLTAKIEDDSECPLPEGLAQVPASGPITVEEPGRLPIPHARLKSVTAGLALLAAGLATLYIAQPDHPPPPAIELAGLSGQAMKVLGGASPAAVDLPRYSPDGRVELTVRLTEELAPEAEVPALLAFTVHEGRLRALADAHVISRDQRAGWTAMRVAVPVRSVFDGRVGSHRLLFVATHALVADELDGRELDAAKADARVSWVEQRFQVIGAEDPAL